jgi:hypothetical protein
MVSVGGGRRGDHIFVGSDLQIAQEEEMKFITPEDWKRSIALVILWAYAYQLVVWPLWFSFATYANAIFGLSLPAPVIVPWEQLMAGTSTLATVGGIQAWRDRNRNETP